MTKEKLPIHKQYLVISAPVEFSLIANNGTDRVLRPAGVWQLDCYKLLPAKYMANYPVFNLELEYDESKIPEGFAFEYYFTNINLGDSLKGVSGDLVELSEYQFERFLSLFPPKTELNNEEIVFTFFDEKLNSSENIFQTKAYDFKCKQGLYTLALQTYLENNGVITVDRRLNIGFFSLVDEGFYSIFFPMNVYRLVFDEVENYFKFYINSPRLCSVNKLLIGFDTFQISNSLTEELFDIRINQGLTDVTTFKNQDVRCRLIITRVSS